VRTVLTPVATLRAVTVALGMTAPVVSVTVPVMPPPPDWACVSGLYKSATNKMRMAVALRFILQSMESDEVRSFGARELCEVMVPPDVGKLRLVSE